MQERSKVGAWLKAARLRTLPLALSSILMAGFLAMSRGVFQADIFLLSVLTTIFLQVLSNFANDYGDTQHGADSIHRAGPVRTVQSGEITLGAMMLGIKITILLSLISGLSLLYVTFGENWLHAFLLLLLGLGAIAAAVYYTMGKSPYGYAGLGDLFVMIFFGFVGVGAGYYLYDKNLDSSILLLSWTVGAFSTGVLNVNNIRDVESDTLAGKKSIPVRIGMKAAKRYQFFLLASGLLTALAYNLIQQEGLIRFVWLPSMYLFFYHLKKLWESKKPQEIDPLLRQLAISTLVFVVFYGLGLYWTIPT